MNLLEKIDKIDRKDQIIILLSIIISLIISNSMEDLKFSYLNYYSTLIVLLTLIIIFSLTYTTIYFLINIPYFINLIFQKDKITPTNIYYIQIPITDINISYLVKEFELDESQLRDYINGFMEVKEIYIIKKDDTLLAVVFCTKLTLKELKLDNVTHILKIILKEKLTDRKELIPVLSKIHKSVPVSYFE